MRYATSADTEYALMRNINLSKVTGEKDGCTIVSFTIIG